MCYLCEASSTDPTVPWYDCRECAAWRGTMYSDESWRALLFARGWAVPALLLLVIGLRLEYITVDPLHAVDQGIGSHIIANVLWYLVVLKRVLGGRTQEQAVSTLNSRLKQWYKDSKARYKLQGELTIERLRSTAASFPKLAAKAAQTRVMAQFVLEFAQEHCDPNDEKEAAMLCVITLLIRFYKILADNSHFLSVAAKQELPRVGQVLAEQYSKLSSWSFDLRQKFWKTTPKLHMFKHMCEFQALIMGNPRRWWTYSDEDLIGIMVEVAESCHPTTMAISILFK